MILDRLDRAELYASLSPPLARAFAFLASPDLAGLADGRHEIDGDRLFAIVDRYITRPAAAGAWEAHRRYIDLQYVVAGSERLGHASLDRLVAGPYDADRDRLPLTGEGDVVTLSAGDFALLFPHDAHMPGLAAGAPAPVHKVVLKIAAERGAR
jgi:YhcH/YjgK/YiaL family protein